MGNTIVVILTLTILLTVVIGVSMRFFNNFGENIAKNHMNELGVDVPELPEDETDERLR